MLLSYVLLICASITTVTSALTLISSGKSGQLCGGNRCCALPVAVCSNNSCVCQPPTTKGFGTFLCTLPGEEFCAIYNDPTLLTFSGHRTAIPLHWIFLAAHIKSNLLHAGTGEKLNGECHAKFYPFGKKFHGKTYSGGFVIEYRVTLNGESYIANYRFTGSAEGGIYRHVIEGNFGNYSGPPYNHPRDLIIEDAGGQLIWYRDETNNVYGIYSPFCGIGAGQRPLDTTDHFTQVSGVYLILEKRANPEYLDLDQTLCSAPHIQEDLLESLRFPLSNLTQLRITKDVSALYKVLIQTGIQQVFPGASPKLSAVTALARSCSTVNFVSGLHYCIFLLTVPPLVNCLDPSDTGDVILSIFTDCLTIFCQYDGLIILCPSVKATITRSRCERYIPNEKVTIFGDVCP